MSVASRLQQLAETAPKRVQHLSTEEATKNALVMPFISALGYDVFDPTEVIPEFTADVGTKQGEKVDYAIKHGDEVVFIVECKKAGAPLTRENASQLYRYFGVLKARIAVLTNGTTYEFFSDLDATNKMDERPFMVVDLLDYTDEWAPELTKMSKGEFDLDTMLRTASDMKCAREIRAAIDSELTDPSDDFLKLIFAKVNPEGRYVRSAQDQYTKLVPRAIQEILKNRVTGRLNSALRQSEEPVVASKDVLGEDGIVTTEDELDAYAAVKVLVAEVVGPERVAFRDHKGYSNVLLDDSNRKPVARFHFDRTQWQVGTFDAEKNETRHNVDSAADIAKFGQLFRDTIYGYLGADKSSPSASPTETDSG